MSKEKERDNPDNPAWKEIDKGFDKLEGFKNDEAEQPQPIEDELWEQVVNIVVEAYEKWMKPQSKGKGDFGETELKKQFTIKRNKS